MNYLNFKTGISLPCQIKNTEVKDENQSASKPSPLPSLKTFFLISCLIFLFASAFAQSPPTHWTDLDSFRVGYQLGTNDTVLQSNQHFSVKLYFRSYSSHPCFGGTFDLLYSNKVSIDNDSNYSMVPQSWLGYENELTSFSILESNNQAEMEISRSDTLERSGTGWVLSANFVVGSKAIEAEKVILSLGGGLIMLDNIDMKRAPIPKVKPERVSLFPNPVRNKFWIQSKSSEDLLVRILNSNGTLIREIYSGTQKAISLEGLKPGILLIEVIDPKNQTRDIFRLLKR